MAFVQESGDHPRDEKQKQPGREGKNADRKGNRRNGFLEQSAKGLDHAHPVRGLHPGALQLVVKLRVFVRGKIKSRGVLHDAYADLAGKPVREKAVGVVTETREDGSEKRQPKRQRHPATKIPGTDRKSTRLNSSHATISYAVFCLKKKNTHEIQSWTRTVTTVSSRDRTTTCTG